MNNQTEAQADMSDDQPFFGVDDDEVRSDVSSRAVVSTATATANTSTKHLRRFSSALKTIQVEGGTVRLVDRKDLERAIKAAAKIKLLSAESLRAEFEAAGYLHLKRGFGAIADEADHFSVMFKRVKLPKRKRKRKRDKEKQ